MTIMRWLFGDHGLGSIDWPYARQLQAELVTAALLGPVEAATGPLVYEKRAWYVADRERRAEGLDRNTCIV